MRPTDVCHPYDLRAPASRAFPVPLATFTAWTPRRVLGSARHDRGTERFTPFETASADCPSHNTDAIRVPMFASCVLPHGFPDTSVGVFFPRREDQSSL